MVASLVALAINRPLADVEGFCVGRILASGHTRRHSGLSLDAKAARKILLVDDSLDTGKSLRDAEHLIRAAYPDLEVVTLVAFAACERAQVAIALEVVPHPRAFEWNILHHPLLARAGVDIDGVICADPTEEQNDDGSRYVDFLLNARPLHIPTTEIAALVTNRLEKYRSETEQWLASNGVRYRQLVMLDLPSKEARQKIGSPGAHKGQACRTLGLDFFIESDQSQAVEIARLSGKPVYCLEDRRMHLPNSLSFQTIAGRSARGIRDLTWQSKQLVKMAIGKNAYATIKRMARRLG